MSLHYLPGLEPTQDRDEQNDLRVLDSCYPGRAARKRDTLMRDSAAAWSLMEIETSANRDTITGTCRFTGKRETWIQTMIGAEKNPWFVLSP